MDIQEAYDQLFEEYLKLRKANCFAFERLNNLEIEKESLVTKLEEFTRSLNELKVE